MPLAHRRLLVLSLCSALAKDLADFLRDEDFEVTVAGDEDAAHAVSDGSAYDAVVLDCTSQGEDAARLGPLVAGLPAAWVVALALDTEEVQAANVTLLPPFDLGQLVERLHALPPLDG